ncbi:MAG: YgiQ family radical SAM protein [Bacteroidales bacterium]|nr:YgiQ family radical SAM protein [Bacteroidales bacterium]NLN36385.1 YgiQ family radical SAM protein [Bacteroidales bacterium]
MYLCRMLPTSRKELDLLEYGNVDIILFSGDAYVDHPSFGPAVIGRVLESQGYRVAIVPQPNWRDDLRDFKKLGIPRLFFGVTAGNMDSMVNHYTAARRLRSNDAYTPEGRAGMRPDYAVTVYTRILKQLYPDIPVIIGGIEASLRRLTHYDYWSDSLKQSVLADSGADYLVYGMGERSITELAQKIREHAPVSEIRKIRQIAYVADHSGEIYSPSGKVLQLPSHQACRKSKRTFSEHFRIIEEHANVYEPPVLAEPLDHPDGPTVVVNPPFPPMTASQLDAVYDLPFSYQAHPRYKGKKIPALEMIRFSVCLHRGCFGGCSFCTIAAHQGKEVSSRSRESVLKEISRLSSLREFRGYLTDLGGPTANMYRMRGKNPEVCSACRRTSCLFPSVCRNLDTSHKPLLDLYEAVRALPGIKKATIGSGIRYDLFLSKKGFLDRDGKRYFETLLQYHVSGRLKVAPEHTQDNVLARMHKPSFDLYRVLAGAFREHIRNLDLKLQLIPYFISSHPGCTQHDMNLLAGKFKKEGIRAEQVQDFTPTPMTKSSVMYYTGLVPEDGTKTFVERDPQKKALQKESFFR